VLPVRHHLALAHFDLMRGAVLRGLRRLAAEPDADTDVNSGDFERLARRVDDSLAGKCDGPPIELSEAELEVEDVLRNIALEADISLPLDELQGWLRLDRQDVLVLCAIASAEYDDEFASLYTAIASGSAVGRPTVGLLARLTAEPGDFTSRRTAIGELGRLRRARLVRVAIPGDPAALQQLELVDGALEFILGLPVDIGVAVDGPDNANAIPVPVQSIGSWDLEPLVDAVADGQIDAIGLWSRSEATILDAAQSIATRLGRELRRVCLTDETTAVDRLCKELLEAPLAGRLLLVTIELPSTEELRRAVRSIEPLLAKSRQPILLGGTHPWRPERLLTARQYLEVNLAPFTWNDRSRAWREVLPSVAGEFRLGEKERIADRLASRFHLSTSEIARAAHLAATEMLLEPVLVNGDRESLLNRACSAVVRTPTETSVRTPRPSASLDRLVLPDDVLSQISEIAAASAQLGFVGEEWGFDRHGGPTGYKALFLGDPGTGKTLAAEVIAGTSGVPLMVVDLAQTVSKWVGETSKNLDGIFEEAERTNAILFFDEADALFGKRAEVRHGTDRYANSEVSHLLVRFEKHSGLVILASNLRENIDNAFVRRFHSVLHFPRPDAVARRRLWSMAFPPEAPLAGHFDIEALVGLDMTGAAIVNSARRAALIAAHAGCSAITMDAVVEAVRRQFQSEARVLRPDDLPGYPSFPSDTREETE
jgi:ATPase family associated with various cellular activities (AAA)